MKRVVFAALVGTSSCTFNPETSAPSTVPGASDGGESVGLDGGDDRDASLDDGRDIDSDGVPDAVDNCLAVPNTGQFDEDEDGLGDLCDNCPQTSNPNQENLGEAQNGQSADAIGDVCDPRPDLAGDVQALFLGFNEANDISSFSKAGAEDFIVQGGMLQARTNTDLGLLWRNDLGAADGTIEAKLTYRNVTTGGYQFRGIALLGMFERSNNFGTGLGCGEMIDIFYKADAFRTRTRFNGGGFSNLDYGDATVAEGRTVTYRANTLSASDVNCAADAVQWSYDGTTQYAGSGIAIANWGTGLDMEYLIVYSQ